jgi:phosphate transport system substrate-binding protein
LEIASRRFFCAKLVAVAMLAACPVATAEVTGAGSSFAALVIQPWNDRFEAAQKIAVRYQSVGSGEGIRRVTAKAVDFALTDIPLTHVELVQADLVQFPVVIGAITPVINLPNIASNELRMSGAVLAAIYLGKIVAWNDPALRALNPKLDLPALPIRVIHRADGSGTTFVFTNYLSKQSAEWQERLGIGSRLHWPAGDGANGNEGMSKSVRETVGSIGYVVYTYALKYGLATVQLGNNAGNYVAPNESNARAALANTTWSRPSYYEIVTDRGGDGSWPIVGVTFVLVSTSPANSTSARETLKFIDWIYRDGSAVAAENHYVAIDDGNLIKRIEASWKTIKDRAGQTIWKDSAN